LHNAKNEELPSYITREEMAVMLNVAYQISKMTLDGRIDLPELKISRKRFAVCDMRLFQGNVYGAF